MNYEDIDSLILNAIKEDGARSFWDINSGAVRTAAESMVAGTSRIAFRIVDARLQALKKKGKIKYQRGGAGWVINEGGAA